MGKTDFNNFLLAKGFVKQPGGVYVKPVSCMIKIYRRRNKIFGQLLQEIDGKMYVMRYVTAGVYNYEELLNGLFSDAPAKPILKEHFRKYTKNECTKKKYAEDPETRARSLARSAAFRKKQYADPEKRKRLLEYWKQHYRNNPEIKERRNARHKERYANDPEYRERCLERSRKCNNKRYASDPKFRQDLIEYGKARYRAKVANKLADAKITSKGVDTNTTRVTTPDILIKYGFTQQTSGVWSNTWGNERLTVLQTAGNTWAGWHEFRINEDSVYEPVTTTHNTALTTVLRELCKSVLDNSWKEYSWELLQPLVCMHAEVTSLV